MIDLSILSCTLSHNRLKDVDDSQPLPKLEESFEIYDDLLLGEYANGLVLDVGWFSLKSTSNLNGFYELKCFLVRLIRTSDWETPAAQFVARDFSELDLAIRAADQWAKALTD